MIAASPEKLFVWEGRTLPEYVSYEKRKEKAKCGQVRGRIWLDRESEDG